MMLSVLNSAVWGHFSFGRLLIRPTVLLGSHASRGSDLQGAVDDGTPGSDPKMEHFVYPYSNLSYTVQGQWK